MTFSNYKSSLIFSVFTLFLAGCSSDSEPTELVPREAESINLYFNDIPDWDNSIESALPDSPVEDVVIPESSEFENIPYKCPVVEKNIIKSQEKIISVGTNQGKIWPGALIEGNSLQSGDVKLILVDRNPITINSDLVIANSFREIQNPNSVSVQQAIVEMQIEAGEMEEGNQAGAGQMSFIIEEAASFSQSMLELGVSAGFTEPQSQVGIEASTNVTNSRAAKTHTIIAKFVQEKFTVRLADDLIPTIADFFADDVTLTDIESLESAGKLGNDNIPLYIESVTYGRILMFSMTSTAVNTSADLSKSLDVSFADYLEAGGNLTTEQKEILENSTTKIYSAGGTEEGANAAIGSLDWSQFFVPAPVATTVPISFTARTLNGNRIKVRIKSNINFEQRLECKEPIAYNIQVELDKVELTSGVCGTCLYTAYLNVNGKTIPDIIDSGLVSVIWSGPGSGGTINFISENEIGNTFRITSGYCTAWTEIFCPVQNLVNSENTGYGVRYNGLKTSAKTSIRHIVNTGINRSIEFNYSITKDPIWE